MKLLKTVRLTGALLAGVLLSLFSANSFALTASGASISNTAAVIYKVGTVLQTEIDSSPTGNSIPGVGNGTATTFVVDTKLLLTIVANDTSDVIVQPGTTTAVLSYTVTNAGNSNVGVLFSIVDTSGALASTAGAGFTGTDNFDPSPEAVIVANAHSGAYNSSTDTSGNLGLLAPGATQVVYIVSTIAGTQHDGDVAVEALKAEVAVATSATYGTAAGTAITTDDTGNPWTPGTVQQLFADGPLVTIDGDANHDGFVSARDVYKVQSAKLTITKTQAVIYDPTGDSTKHAIPGAVVQYTITVANSALASTPATSIALTDLLPTNTTWGGNSVGAAGGTLNVTTPGVGNPTIGANFSCPDTVKTTTSATSGSYTAVSCDYNVTATSTVTIGGVYLAPGDTSTIVYTVTIN